MFKIFKKLSVRFRKKEKTYKSEDTHYGEIETNILSGFIISDGICDENMFSNFILYQEANNNDTDSIEELNSLMAALQASNISSLMHANDNSTILIMSGSIDDYNALRQLYYNYYNLAYNKHLKKLLNYLDDYSILDFAALSTVKPSERLAYPIFEINIQIHDSHDIHISDTSSAAFREISDKYGLEPMNILPLLKVYYNCANLNFEEGSEDYTTYAIESLTQFMYDYSFKFENCVVERINELGTMIPDDFRIALYDRNIFELNLFSNPLDSSSAYDDVDEVID